MHVTPISCDVWVSRFKLLRTREKHLNANFEGTRSLQRETISINGVVATDAVHLRSLADHSPLADQAGPARLPLPHPRLYEVKGISREKPLPS